MKTSFETIVGKLSEDSQEYLNRFLPHININQINYHRRTANPFGDYNSEEQSLDLQVDTSKISIQETLDLAIVMSWFQEIMILLTFWSTGVISSKQFVSKRDMLIVRLDKIVENKKKASTNE